MSAWPSKGATARFDAWPRPIYLIFRVRVIGKPDPRGIAFHPWDAETLSADCCADLVKASAGRALIERGADSRKPFQIQNATSELR